MSIEYPDITWVQDSAGVSSCHVNGVSLTFDDSLIGRLLFNRTNSQWSAVLKDGSELGSFPSMLRARMALEGHHKEKNKKYPRKPEIR